MKWKYFLVISFVIVEFSSTEPVQDSIMDNFTWECANNASCVNTVARNIIKKYQSKQPIDFGLFSVKPLLNSSQNVGDVRSSSVVDFFNGNTIKIPIGPMVFSIQRTDDQKYLEVALLKKVSEENGRRHGGGNIRGGHKEKKHLQMFIPMYLAASTFGWTMTAVKAVAVLTLKALLVSKLALIIAAGLIIKKLMENAAERMYIPPHYPEHHEHPFMLPYSMEYAHLPHAITGAEISPHDLLSLHVSAGHSHDNFPQASGAVENLVAESSLNHNVHHQVQNNTSQAQIASGSSITYPKVKRDDHSLHHNSQHSWTGLRTKPTVLNYGPPTNPLYLYGKL